MPIVNHFIKSGNSTVYLYNLYLGRIFSNSSGDQIIPLVGQSYIFFGWILSPLLSVVSIILMRIADKQFFYATNYMKYVWAFISIWFGLETILNMTINLSWIYIRIIPLFITFWFIEKLVTNRKSKKGCEEMKEKSRTYNSISNSIWGMMSALITVVLNFAVRIIIIRALGEEINGLHNLFQNTINVMALMETGISSAMVIHLYEPVKIVIIMK